MTKSSTSLQRRKEQKYYHYETSRKTNETTMLIGSLNKLLKEKADLKAGFTHLHFIIKIIVVYSLYYISFYNRNA